MRSVARQEGSEEVTETIAEPYSFTGPYAGCFESSESAMDLRHIFMMHGVLTSRIFDSALEIGCFNGASSTAFVEATNSGHVSLATFCDVSLTESLIDVVQSAQFPQRVRVTRQPSWQVLDTNETFDFILVDAAHDIDSVSLELKHLVRRRPLCVMAHDTSATDHGYSKCEGAKMLKNHFLRDEGYHCVEDRSVRQGERTERGLFLATTDTSLYKAAFDVFQSYSR
jgi:hypothetical protein